jgi:hypothetical protein
MKGSVIKHGLVIKTNIIEESYSPILKDMSFSSNGADSARSSGRKSKRGKPMDSIELKFCETT